MQKVYKDKPVTVIRTAHDGDVGFDPKNTTGVQSLIRLQDGGDIAVLNSDLTEVPELVPVMERAKAPESAPLTNKTPQAPQSPVDHLIHSTDH